jgi:hypothetical protein
MAISRPLSPFEQVFLPSKLYCHTVMVLESKSARDELITRLKSQILGLRLKTDGRSFISVPNPKIPVYPLPPFFPSHEQAVLWVWHHAIPPQTEALGSIAADDTTVILNLHHIIDGGGYNKVILDHIFGDKIGEPDSVLPISNQDILARQFVSAPPGIWIFVDKILTRLFPTRTSLKPWNPQVDTSISRLV